MTSNTVGARGVRALSAAALVIGCAALLPASALAQDPAAGPLPWPQTQPPQDPTRPPLLPNPLEILLRGADVHPRARSGAAQHPAFQPFPVLAPPGFGAYPGGQLAVPYRDPGLAQSAAPLQPRSANAWPTWLPGSAEGEGGFTAEVAIVAQSTDYVWLLEPGAEAYEPLAFWDRFRVVPSGTAVDVRGGGQFALAFQRGAVARVIGRARMQIERLDQEVSAIGFDELNRVVVVASERPVRVRVGQAGSVEVVSSRLSFQHERGLVHVQNLGPGGAELRVGDRRERLQAGHRVTLLPALPPGGPGAALGLADAVETSRDGRALTATGSGQGGGRVDWSGARFEVPRGAVLRIDPLAGRAFPEGFHDKP